MAQFSFHEAKIVVENIIARGTIDLIKIKKLIPGKSVHDIKEFVTNVIINPRLFSQSIQDIFRLAEKALGYNLNTQARIQIVKIVSKIQEGQTQIGCLALEQQLQSSQ
ncbi:Hypothetical_protein [Hexamita inflata]|uniref:Hypothetical_protein n=1 Tax=Hexamita inflata TaxID=28002 RepID=A0AA86N427_9EUKA|nr:Hypothetical protein HINF_LOCUS55 [Hexamita inflata]CAI9955513.1 Hypothetical protein HINF_LOCUS43158 [Hexamita inflata]